MTFKHFKGDFNTLEEVWKRYPSGGAEGDYLNVDGQILRWNDINKQWTVPNSFAPSSARNTKQVFSDLAVENDLNVGGILRARVVRGRSASCGLFVDETALLKHYPKPLVGQWALVTIENRTDEDGNAIGRVYVCKEDGQWEDAGYNGGLDGEGDALLTECEERKEGDLGLSRALIKVITSLVKEKEERKNDVYKLQHAIDVLYKELNDYKHSGGDPDMGKYQSLYIGAGNSYDDVMHVAYSIPVTEDAHATYNVACGSGEHIIIVIKSTLIENFLRADMNGFEISFTTSEVMVGDIAYTVLTSENVFAMGTYNIDLTMSFPKTEE